MGALVDSMVCGFECSCVVICIMQEWVMDICSSCTLRQRSLYRSSSWGEMLSSLIMIMSDTMGQSCRIIAITLRIWHLAFHFGTPTFGSNRNLIDSIIFRKLREISIKFITNLNVINSLSLLILT